ncbi:MAG: VCBS repeat-containing protein, partial [Candidatus Aenigmarchaeota archaeon]|nr:VCBS repeat-containing protein [Candidatus Aenigmarchaeota archaeon]
MWGLAEYRTLFKYDTTKPLLYFLFDDRDNFVHSASWQDVNSPTPNTDLHLILHSYDTGGTLKVDYIFVRKLAPNGNEPDVSHADLNATVLLNATSSATATEMFYYLDEENKVTACTSCSSFQRALVPGGSTDKWWNFYWNYRVNITVNTGYMPRKANAVTQSIIDFGSVLDALGESGTIDQNSIRVVNVDGEVLPSEVLRWLTLDKAMIRFKLTENETLDKETDYKYYIYFDILEHNSKAEVKLDLPRIYAMASHGRYSYYSGEEGEWGLWQSSGAGMRKLAIADFDNDGDYDYVANVGSYVYLYENTNDDYWSFIRSTVTSHSMHYADLAVCDFNEDGNLDFATSYQNGSWSATSATHFIMLWGNGDGTFNETYIDQIDKPAYYPIGGVCGDFDGDGNMDAMMFHRRCYSTAHRAYGKVYWGDGNGNFEKDAAWVGYERASPYGGTWIID